MLLRSSGGRALGPAAALLPCLLLLSLSCAGGAGLEDMFRQGFGGGGARTFTFSSGGGGGQQFFPMGGKGQERKRFKWPEGTPDKITKRMDWLKGTEWSWNDAASVKFRKDGIFEAPGKCQQNDCKWAASRGKVYILWADLGMYELDVQGELPKDQDPTALQGMKMKGHRVSDRGPCEASFRRIFDLEAAELNKDLYGILGLTDDAEEADIKKVYRKLSIKYHPDKNPDEESKNKFKEVRDAYEILNDPDKKILYDTGGMEAVKKSEKGEVKTTEDVTKDLNVNLEDLYNSGVTKARIKRRVVCRGCRLQPDAAKCKACGRCPNEIRMGKREVMPGMFVPLEEEVESKEKCKQEDTVIDVQMEKGMRDGESVSFPRMTDQRPGMLPGKLVFTMRTRKHPKFERRSDDLHMNIQVSLREALLGWRQNIRHLDGHILEVGTSSVTRPFQVLRVKGEGMPLRDDPASFGDLYVRVEIVFPKALTSEQQALAGDLFAVGPAREEL